tara:strand:+ start:314 stop:508 length:195 start_codon:yes stop_codon:yes gene_type:complete
LKIFAKQIQKLLHRVFQKQKLREEDGLEKIAKEVGHSFETSKLDAQSKKVQKRTSVSLFLSILL